MTYPDSFCTGLVREVIKVFGFEGRSIRERHFVDELGWPHAGSIVFQFDFDLRRSIFSQFFELVGDFLFKRVVLSAIEGRKGSGLFLGRFRIEAELKRPRFVVESFRRRQTGDPFAKQYDRFLIDKRGAQLRHLAGAGASTSEAGEQR